MKELCWLPVMYPTGECSWELLSHSETRRHECIARATHRRPKVGCVSCVAEGGNVVESKRMALFWDFGQRAVGRWAWARRVLGLLWAIVMV